MISAPQEILALGHAMHDALEDGIIPDQPVVMGTALAERLGARGFALISLELLDETIALVARQTPEPKPIEQGGLEFVTRSDEPPAECVSGHHWRLIGRGFDADGHFWTWALTPDAPPPFEPKITILADLSPGAVEKIALLGADREQNRQIAEIIHNSLGSMEDIEAIGKILEVEPLYIRKHRERAA